ncbi:MAG TPA: DUF3352 domain-containing protein [Solirubrobacterales bacterium]|nr:DUF3352 domain-containing protein [Solirubrobacterales bacterium]
MTRTVAAGGAALALALGTAACGGDDGRAEVPASASLAPADSPVFAEATVRPEGDQAEAADSALSKLLNTDDPGAFLVEQLDNALQEDESGIAYSEDVEPWLGENAGLFFTTFADEPDGAAVLEVTDQGAAEAAVDKIERSEGSPGTDEFYEGVEYTRYEEDSAVGFVDSFLVAGTEAGFRASVDASGGEALADDDAYTEELGTAPDDTLATLYANVPAVLDRLVEDGEISERQRQETEERVGAPVQGPALATLTAAEDDVAVQVAAAAGDTPEPEESPLLRELPADSWLAFGVDDLGEHLSDSFESLELSGGATRFDLDEATEELLGLRLSELTSWIGDVGGYASGTSIFGLGTALELETTDEESSAATLDSLRRSLSRIRSLRIEPLDGDSGFTVSPSDAPVQIAVVQREGRVVAGLGEKSIDAVLEPDETLDGSDAFGSATNALGDDFAASFFLDFEPMLELFESTGANDDPGFQSAKPYLDPLDYVVTGQGREDDQSVMRLVLGLR